MKMAKKIILATIMFPIALGTASAFAASNGDKNNQKGDHKNPRMEQCAPGLNLTPRIIKRLDLTDAQKQKIKALRQANGAEMKVKMAKHDKQMNELLLADKFDKSKATAMVKEEQNNRVERQVNRLEKQFQTLNILTPEQKAKFADIEKKQHQKCGDKMNHGKGKKPMGKGDK
ncbi:Spy/CpxP family protein refolding chaperone [Marinomonas flavescens]|uniref:Spy/CpxP family protein refolding chaperone n=1 Tax=Marinomonas flavescens TaxID=2529379 RepID=UPI0010567D7E|nr:Spy/CpxP family protein refolding chaperone [Marinomonas flavescens]